MVCRGSQSPIPSTTAEGIRRLPFPPDSFDAVLLAGNSFGYFESKRDDLQVLKEVFRVLKPGGRLIIDVTDGRYVRKHFDERSWEWIDEKHYVCRERSLSSDRERLITREVIANVKKGVIADQFYGERLYSRESLKTIIESATLSSIVFHTEMVTRSKRNQDLGMMAKRLIVTAEARKEWSPARKGKKTGRLVPVLLGDPRRSDVVKPNASFDDDDMHTVNELKRALGSLDEYRFVYLDQHGSLIADLQKIRGKADYVFNLCDEGFNNEATKELHVPSLLEILGIPYTGGNPKCLSYCYDKSLVRGIAQEMDIPVPRGFLVEPEDIAFISLPITEEDYSDLPEGLPRICGYEAKWIPESPYWNIRSVPAELGEDTERYLVASCVRLFERMNCRDYARFDWRLDRNGTPRLLEVNPNPGWCWDGHLAKMSAIAGLSYAEMLHEILKAAEQRLQRESESVT